jgi:ribose/xylose/arabinose/galactoside ABC-type transport system permease subunit
VFRGEPFQAIGLGRVLGVPVQVILMLALCAGLALMLRHTVFGRWVLAVGGNPRAARLAGVPTGFVIGTVYALSAVLAGLAGFVVISINSSSDANLVGLNIELDAIAAALVGGTLLAGGRARLVGCVLGALLLQLLRTTLLSQGVPDAAAMVVKAAIIVAAVAVQARGPDAVPASGLVAWDAAGLRRAGHAVLGALALLILFGALRYDNFLGSYNITTVLAYNAMFACIALGMTFVIATGGIDLSVGTVAALASVVAALASAAGLAAGIAAGVGAGLAFGLLNGALVAGLRLSPFIATLASLLAARGLALLASGNRSVPIATTTDFMQLGMGAVLGVPVVIPVVVALFVGGWLC